MASDQARIARLETQVKNLTVLAADLSVDLKQLQAKYKALAEFVASSGETGETGV